MPSSPRRALGDFGERIAAEHLRAKGYKILATKYRVREGEVDIIAQQGDTVVFVEVKTRRGDAMGTAVESLREQQARHLLIAAETFCQERDDLPPGRRVDLIAIDLDTSGRVVSLEHVENAVEGT